MTFSQVVEQFFSVFSSLWQFISNNSLLMIGVFAPVVIVSIIAIINALR